MEIPYHIVDTIDLNNQLVERKCYNMFKTWLERRTTSLCWCKFAEDLHVVGLEGVAEDAKNHLEEQSCVNSGSITPPGVMSSQ